VRDLHWYRSIGFKTVLSVAVTAILVNGFFGYLGLTIHEKHLNTTILRSASQLSDTIKKSIRFDMLENRKENAYRIMETIAGGPGGYRAGEDLQQRGEDHILHRSGGVREDGGQESRGLLRVSLREKAAGAAHHV
jgi:hypothetical protein